MTNIPTLTQDQNQVYQAALELGEATVQQIAKKADLPRSSTYLIVDDLIQLGLMASTKQGQKTLLVAESPQKLVRLIEHKQFDLEQSKQTVKQLLPQLEAIHNQQLHKPVVKFYQGIEGIKTIFEQSLKADEILLLCSGYQEQKPTDLTEYMSNEYLPETNKLGIKSREIITHDPDSKSYIKEYGSASHQIRFSSQVPSEKHIDKLLFNNVVAIIAFDTMTGTVIEHRDIADFERSQFEQLWLHAQ